MSSEPRIGLDNDGTLDDFMAENVRLIHFEALDDADWSAVVILANGDIWQLYFGAKSPKAAGYASAELVEKNS